MCFPLLIRRSFMQHIAAAVHSAATASRLGRQPVQMSVLACHRDLISSPLMFAAYMSSPCHIELTLTEKEAPVKGEDDGKEKKLSKIQRARALRSGVVSRSS